MGCSICDSAIYRLFVLLLLLAPAKEEWQFRTDFSDLHEEFPELVDKTGKGWFYRHVHKVERFITKNSDNVSKTTD